MRITVLLIALICLVVQAPAIHALDHEVTGLIRAQLPWWGWASLLFGFTMALGVVAVIGGVGGGVLFVPVVAAIFPFHLDFVRGAGLMVALCGSLSAIPILLRRGIADIRLGLPMALFGSIGSIAGAFLGLALPTGIVEAALGVAILSIVALMLTSSRSEYPRVERPDALGAYLGIGGSYYEYSLRRPVAWRVHRTGAGMLIYLGIGVIGGMFGVGAGWANVPALNLLLGAPLKVAVGTSGYIMTLNAAAASWVYAHGGAILPLVTVPSVAGMMIGTRIGAQILPRIRSRRIRYIVVAILSVSGLRSLVAGIMGLI